MLPAQHVSLKIIPTCFFLLLVFGLGKPLAAETGRYRLSWAEDPATTISIAFEFKRGRDVYVAYDTQDGVGVPNNYRFKAAPTSTHLAHGMRTVFVRIRNLQPETVYYFMVVDDDGLSRPMSFETAPNRLDRRISVVAGGDSRENQAARRKTNILVSKIRPHLIFFSGDMTNDDSPAEWAEWLDDWQLTISSDGRCYPVVPARGNHERANTSITSVFDVPNPNLYFALDFGGGLFRSYTLNSMALPTGDQLEWLKADLRSHPDVVWKFAQYHNAMRPHTANKMDRDDLVKYWAPLFYTHSVGLVMESDAHVVKQTWPIRPSTQSGSEGGFIRDDLSGTVYIGEGCWGAPLRPNNDDKSWTQASGSFNQIKWMWVSASRVEIRTVITDQSVNCLAVSPTDRFSVPKGMGIWKPGGNEVLILNKARPREIAQQGPPPVHPNQPVSTPPSAWPTGGGSVTNDPSGGGGNIARPAPLPATTLEVLKPDFQSKVQLEFTHRQYEPVIMLIVTDKAVLFHKAQLPIDKPGIYRERITLPEIPRGVKWELVLKSGTTIVKKYVLSTQPD